ncbi:MAG: NAD(P)H-binding protein, partial [Sciscionella sp.]
MLGASGYVGRRLVPLLRQSGHEVRCLIRASSHARPTDGHPGVEIVTGDVLNLSDVRGALRGVDAVYHLVHALGRADFPDRDRRAAHTVAEAAETAGVRRIVYLGGLQPSDPDSTTGGVSAHLASRAEVGQIFLHSTVPAAVLRASIIIGSGSTSFEMLRYLTQRVPIIPLPSWARHHTQPIAIADVLHYLVRSLALPDTLNRSFDIGGPDIVTYRQLIQRCARAARLPVPWSPPAPKLPGGLAAALCGVLTPIPPRLAAPLIESLAHNMVCSEQDITALLGEPDAGPTSLDQAITAASRVHGTTVELTNGSTSPARTVAGDPPGAGGPQFVTEHTLSGNCDPDRLWEL